MPLGKFPLRSPSGSPLRNKTEKQGEKGKNRRRDFSYVLRAYDGITFSTRRRGNLAREQHRARARDSTITTKVIPDVATTMRGDSSPCLALHSTRHFENRNTNYAYRLWLSSPLRRRKRATWVGYIDVLVMALTVILM